MRHSRKTLLDSSCLRQTSARLLRLVMAAFLVLLCSTGLTVLSTSFHGAWAQDSGGDSGGSDGSGSDSGTSEGESTDPSTCELCGGGGSDQNGGGADSSETGQTEQSHGGALGREDGYGYADDGAGYSFGANYGFGDMSQAGLSLGQNDFGGLSAGTTEMASEPSFNSSMAGLPGAPGNEMLGASLGVEQMLSDAPRPQDTMSVEVALGPQSRDELVGGMLLGAGVGGAVVGSSAVQSGSSPSLTEQAQGAWNSVVDAVQGFFGGMFSEEVRNAESPNIEPSEVTGKSPSEIDQLAVDSGLLPKGPDPMNGKGSYVDPVTGEQRILVHEDHAHVNDREGHRLDINGNRVHPNSPEAHLPIKQP